MTLALLISYLAVFIPPDKLWVPSFFSLAFPVIVLINFLFVVFWAIVKPRFLFFSLVAIVLGWGFIKRYVQFSGNTTEKSGVKIISYNVHNFEGNGVGGQKKNADKILAFLDEKNADIICLQESRLRKNNIFNVAGAAKNLKSIYHYHYARSSET
ncbi:MAG TPA: hypothetical protein P5210_16380, partial [Draconibacterium sp.]|nr:hypothetical protein [Draconibacterium sp.]